MRWPILATIFTIIALSEAARKIGAELLDLVCSANLYLFHFLPTILSPPPRKIFDVHGGREKGYWIIQSRPWTIITIIPSYRGIERPPTEVKLIRKKYCSNLVYSSAKFSSASFFSVRRKFIIESHNKLEWTQKKRRRSNYSCCAGEKKTKIRKNCVTRMNKKDSSRGPLGFPC